MSRTISVFVVVLAVLAGCSASVEAQPRATLILTSGDRVSGLLADLGGYDFTMVVGGEERNIAKGQVAVVDLIGGGENIPTGDTSRMQAGRHLVCLRGGDIFYGTLRDISSNTFRMTFDTPDGPRTLHAGDVSRIYMARWVGMPEAGVQQQQQPQRQPELQQGTRGVPVPARRCWTDTGFYVASGQYVSFSATGEIQLSDDPEDVSTAAGSKQGRYAPNAPLPGDLAGAFIGRVGNGRAFGIGDQTQPLPMPGAGQLWVGINDDNCGDNRGEFRVEINVSSRLR